MVITLSTRCCGLVLMIDDSFWWILFCVESIYEGLKIEVDEGNGVNLIRGLINRMWKLFFYWILWRLLGFLLGDICVVFEVKNQCHWGLLQDWRADCESKRSNV